MTISVKTYIKGEFLSAADLNATLTTLVDEINRVAALPPEGQKNYIINGDFSVWQRGVSQTSSGYGSDDRWVNEHNGSTKTASQQSFTLGQTDVPGNPKYYSRTVVSSVAGASYYALKFHKMEDVTKLSGEEVTLSFWAKADAAKNIAVEFAQSFGTGGSPSARVNAIGVTTVALTTSWAKHTVTVTLPSVTGKTLGTNGDDHLQIIFWFDAGSDYNSRTKSLGQQSGTFDIANVQLEKGDTATDFEYIDEATQLARCQRYCFIPDSDGDAIYATIGLGYATSATRARIHVRFPVAMRDAPTLNVTYVTQFVLDDLAGVSQPTTSMSISSINTTTTETFITADVSSGLTTRYSYFLLRGNSVTGQLEFDAEL